MMKFSLLFFVAIISFVFVFSKPHDKKSRVVDPNLSDEEHHEEDPESHNKNYDHEAFLGKEKSKEFDELSSEESRKRLKRLVREMVDKNKDDKVDKEELRVWIKRASSRYLLEDARRQFKDILRDEKSDFITWDQYKKHSHGDEPDDSEFLVRDKKRFAAADQNNDGKLSIDEFKNFLHPEEAPHMLHLVLEETLGYVDKNKDGKISMEEYIMDMWTPSPEEKTEPEWVEKERNTFKKDRDLDKNGFLEGDEIRKWIIPDDSQNIEEEIKHLFKEADMNKDDYLSIDEIDEKHDVFAGSQATDYGDSLRHDPSDL